MKDKQTIAQFLNVKDFPFEIKNKNGKLIYIENSEGYWVKRRYDDQGNEIYFENSKGYWYKSKPIIELTLEDIAKMKGVDVDQIRINE